MDNKMRTARRAPPFKVTGCRTGVFYLLVENIDLKVVTAGKSG